MTGIELITQERKEQIEKHFKTIEHDARINIQHQLCDAATQLAEWNKMLCIEAEDWIPIGWDVEAWRKMFNKPYKERLIIAGALIAAEIDRLQMGIDK